MQNVTVWLVFSAGIASFLSPCFLPMIPLYLGYMTGNTLGSRGKKNAILNSIGFILGFTIVFGLLGIAASSVGRFFIEYKGLFSKIMGALIVFMGLFYMEIIPVKMLNMEKRFIYEGKKNNFVGALLLGAAMGFGWTPCIGPILASVLSLAASQDSWVHGLYLLVIYSAGLGIPFIIMAALLQGMSFKIRRILKYTKVIKIITGIILIVTGIIVYTGCLVKLSSII